MCNLELETLKICDSHIFKHLFNDSSYDPITCLKMTSGNCKKLSLKWPISPQNWKLLELLI